MSTEAPTPEQPKEIDGPEDLPAHSWRRVLGRAWRELQDDDLTDRAAALTYYAVLSLLPGMLVLVALLGLLGEHPRTTDALLEIVSSLGPASAVDTFRGPIEEIVKARGGAGALLGVGLAASVWSASAYVGAFTRALNVIYEREETRPFWILRPLQLCITVGMVIGFALATVTLVASGPIARAVGRAMGMGDTALAAWSIARWPVLALLLALLVAALYHVTPNVRQPSLRWITPGGALAVTVWIAASAGFAFYVANFGSYSATYGSLGAFVVVLIWLWLTNLALLLGAELDAELERERELADGEVAALGRIQLPTRRARQHKRPRRPRRWRWVS